MVVNDKAVKEKAVRAVKAALLLEIDQLILEIDQLILLLKQLDPNPLGTESQLLAHAEIEVLNIVKYIVNTLKVE